MTSKYDKFFETEKPFDTTKTGIAVNTLLGLPKAFVQTGKDILKGTVRSIASTGLTLAKPFGGEEEKQAEDFKSFIGQGVWETVFGNEPVKTLETRIAENEIKLQNSPVAKSIGVDKVALPLAFAGVVGGSVLDLTPFGGGKKITQQLTKEITEDGALKILKNIGIKDEIAKQFAPQFSKTKTIEETEDVFNVMQSALGVDKLDEVTKLESSINEETIKPIISEADKLIADGKIRVVSRDNRDVYQYKKGNKWVNARDEASAINSVFKEPKSTAIQLPSDLEQKQIALEITKESLENDPAKQLERYISKRGDFAGQLKEVTGTGKSVFGKKGDDIASELGFEDTEQARQAFEKYSQRKQQYIEQKSILKQEINNFKESQLKSKTPELLSKSPSVKVAEAIPLELSTGEARTLQKMAQESLEQANLEDDLGALSLPRSIEVYNTLSGVLI